MLSIVTYFLHIFLRKKKKKISRINIHFEKFRSTFISNFWFNFHFNFRYFFSFLVTHLRTFYLRTSIKNNKYLSKKATHMHIIENQPCRKSILARIESTNILRRSDFSQSTNLIFWERERERENVVTRWHSRLILGKLRPSHYINRLNCRLCKECDWISAHNAHTGIDVSIETLTCKLPRDPIIVFSSK